jgi:hypothetical protein
MGRATGDNKSHLLDIRVWFLRCSYFLPVNLPALILGRSPIHRDLSKFLRS